MGETPWSEPAATNGVVPDDMSTVFPFASSANDPEVFVLKA